MKKIYLTGIVCIISIIAQAQAKHNEISIGISGGISAFHYSVTEGKYRSGGGGSINLGYLLKVTDHWGIGTGAELALYQSKTILDEYSDNYSVLSNSIPGGTAEQNLFDFRFTYTGFREEQKAIYLNVPVFFQLQTQKYSGLYVKAGIKIGIPVKAFRKTRYSALRTSGYFPYEGVEYTDLLNHGFGSYQPMTKKSDMELRFSLSPFAEIGWKWRTHTHRYIYTGIYGEYGIRKIHTAPQGAPLLQYHDEGTTSGNPVWESSRLGGKNPAPITSSRIRPMAIGVVIRWAFAL